VDILADAEGNQPDPSNFAGSFRAGWSDTGLLLAIKVRAINSHEAENLKKLYEGDSVEVFLSTDAYNDSATPANARNVLQAVFAPGLSDTHPELRTFIYDHRSPAVRSVMLHPHVDAERMSLVNGYQIEAIIPWDNLGVTPSEGACFGLQVQINNSGKPRGNSRLIWNATPGIGHVVRLAVQPSAPIQLAVTGQFDDYNYIRVDLAAKGPTAQPVEISDGKQSLAKATLVARPDGVWTAQVRLPVTGDTSPEHLSVSSGGTQLAFIPLPPVSEVRRKALEHAEFSIRDAIFSGDVFPSGAWTSPKTFADLLGKDYTSKVTYYDAEAHLIDKPSKVGRYGAVVVAASADGAKQVSRFLNLCKVSGPLPNQGPLTAVMLGLSANLSAAQLESLAKLGDRIDRSAEIAASLLESSPAASLLRPGNDQRNYRYRVMTAHGLEKPYTPVVLKPAGYDEKPDERWPLILFLHGSGRGTQAWADIEPTRVFLSQHREYPFLLVQLVTEQGPWTPQKVLDQLTALQSTYRIDSDRIYLCGFSMGGAGTWEVLAEAPDVFAAAIPTASRADLATASRLVHVPIWVFHSDLDFMPAQNVINMVDAIAKDGGKVRLTMLRNTDHVQTPLTVFSERDVYDWLLQHRRSER
jgi:predicted esterase